MKTKSLIKKLYIAIFSGSKEEQNKLYKKITRKSLKHKKTQAVR